MAFEENTRAAAAREQAPAPDALRALVATLVQETLRTEFDQFLGAGPYERTPERRGRRNGTYPRTLRDPGGGAHARDSAGSGRGVSADAVRQVRAQ